MFIGLGPNGDVTEELLRAKLEEVCPITSIRMRSSCAFADVSCDREGDKLIEKLNGSYINTSRLSVQHSNRDHRRVEGSRRGERSTYRRREGSDSRDRHRARRSDSRDRWRRRSHRSRDDTITSKSRSSREDKKRSELKRDTRSNNHRDRSSSPSASSSSGSCK